VGKQVAGHKHHVVVDTEALPLAVQVQSAAVQDPVGAAPVLAEAKARVPKLQLVWGDSHYQSYLVALAAQAVGLRVEVVSKPPGIKSFTVLLRRWMVECSLSWSVHHKRIARDYERLAVSLQQLYYLFFIGLMLAKAAGLNLHPNPQYRLGPLSTVPGRWQTGPTCQAQPFLLPTSGWALAVSVSYLPVLVLWVRFLP
jgi:transposase